MKKIISIALVIACVCMLFACGGPSAKDFQTAIDASNPTSVKITTLTVTPGLGGLTGEYFVTYNADGSAAINGNYQVWETIPTDGSEFSEEGKKSVPVSVTRNADGTYSDESFAESADLAALALKLEGVSADCTFSEDGNTLTVTVAKDSTEAVFGTAFAYDIKLTVRKGVSNVEKVTLEYVTGASTVTVETAFTY